MFSLKIFDAHSWYAGQPIFSFENSRLTDAIDRFSTRYQYVGFVCGLVYVATIFGLKKWMLDRDAFRLKMTAVGWNLFLTCLNALAAIRIIPFLVSLLNETSFYNSVCADTTFLSDPVAGLWTRAFPYMKIAELGDTLLIVLQKRRLATYYWTHHLGSLLVAWYLYPFAPTAALWVSLIVDLFHVPVYVYATSRSLGAQPSEVVRAALAVLEMAHMTVNLGLCASLLRYIGGGAKCTIDAFNVVVLLVIFAFCLTLATELLVRRYARRRSKAQPPSPTLPQKSFP